MRQVRVLAKRQAVKVTEPEARFPSRMRVPGSVRPPLIPEECPDRAADGCGAPLGAAGVVVSGDPAQRYAATGDHAQSGHAAENVEIGDSGLCFRKVHCKIR